MEDDNDDDVMATMQKVDDALGTGDGGGGAAAASAAGGPEMAPSLPNPCEAYDKIRDLLPDLIKIAKKIPVVGKRLAKALELLKQIGDQFCPA